ncbi:MAG: hypothetical protein RKP20_00150 [Candidatus Competibacter sp.]|nr:hypothetical protein [Candidatus Competibacter sp.]
MAILPETFGGARLGKDGVDGLGPERRRFVAGHYLLLQRNILNYLAILAKLGCLF